jgi:hypothetical protein
MSSRVAEFRAALASFTHTNLNCKMGLGSSSPPVPDVHANSFAAAQFAKAFSRPGINRLGRTASADPELR